MSRSILDEIPDMDKKKATKLVVYGLILAIIGISVLIVSYSIASNAGSWQNIAIQENQINFWEGFYGYNEYLERNVEISRTYSWMTFQDAIFGSIGQIVIFIGLAIMFIGILSHAMDKTSDNKIRLVFTILAAVVIYLLVIALI